MEAALQRRETDHPPHFELVFQLEEETFSRRFPSLRGLEGAARERALMKGAELMAAVAERFEWDALCAWHSPQTAEGITAARKVSGNDILIGTFIWEGVWSIDTVKDWDGFSSDLAERPNVVHAEGERRLAIACDRATRCLDAGADFLLVGSDVGFNGGPFLSPTMFREFVTPYLQRLCRFIRDRGAFVIFHSDGQITPVLDQIMDAGPHCWHSVDPMAGVDIAEAKRLTAGRMALMGNVRCDYLQHGTPEQIRESAEYCLKHGSPGGGYLFSSSNTIFRGVPLANYEYMLKVYREFVNQPGKKRV